MHAFRRIHESSFNCTQPTAGSRDVIWLASLIGVLALPMQSIAEDGVGYSPSLNDDVTNNALILPSSGGASLSGARPFIQLKDSDAKALVVPMPESAITQEPTHGNVKTKPLPVYIK